MSARICDFRSNVGSNASTLANLIDEATGLAVLSALVAGDTLIMGIGTFCDGTFPSGGTTAANVVAGKVTAVAGDSIVIMMNMLGTLDVSACTGAVAVLLINRVEGMTTIGAGNVAIQSGLYKGGFDALQLYGVNQLAVAANVKNGISNGPITGTYVPPAAATAVDPGSNAQEHVRLNAAGTGTVAAPVSPGPTMDAYLAGAR